MDCGVVIRQGWLQRNVIVVDHFSMVRVPLIRGSPTEYLIYLEIAGGRKKKGNVVGLGQLGDQYIRSSQSCSQDDCNNVTPNFQEVIANLNAMITTKDNEIREISGELQHTTHTLDHILQHLGLQPPPDSAVGDSDIAPPLMLLPTTLMRTHSLLLLDYLGPNISWFFLLFFVPSILIGSD